MAINLEQTYIDPDLEQDGQRVFEPLLRSLQCNILKSHGREWAFHIFLRFTGDPTAIRAWIRNFTNRYVTSAATQLEQTRAYKARQQAELAYQREQQPLNQVQTDLKSLEQRRAETGEVIIEDELVGAFFLSADGYRYLGFDVGGFDDSDKDGSFQRGMKARHEGLLNDIGDTIFDTTNKDPLPQDWEAPYQGEVHAMILLARDWESGNAVRAIIQDEVIPSLAGLAEHLTTEVGHVLRAISRPEAEGKDEAPSEGKGSGKGQPIEHFGYVDGRSQPLFLKGDIDKEVGGMDHWDPTAPLSLVVTPDPLIDVADSYGSYFVFRKLEQDVVGFREAVPALADKLDVHPNLAGALAVGRFKDGTPVTLQRMAGLHDINNFEYGRADNDGNRCPRHAHVRKVNPRGTTPFMSLEDERKHRIARRGIPYGEAQDVGISPVGLLFMCYQSNIGNQFKFIQRTWADNPNFPQPLFPRTGDDPLIGQDTDDNADQNWPVRWGESERVSSDFGGYITLRGGEYFFAPSITFLSAL